MIHSLTFLTDFPRCFQVGMLCTTPTVEHVSSHTINRVIYLNEEFLNIKNIFLKQHLKLEYFQKDEESFIYVDVVSVFADGRRGFQGAADKDSLHGQSGRTHHPAPDFGQQSCALSL